MADIVVGYVNLHPEDWDGLDRTITRMYDPQFQPPEDWRAVKWVREADLDQDGQDEIILAYAVPLADRPGALVANPQDLADRWSVLVRVDGGYRLAHRGAEGWFSYVLDTPRFEFVRDVNGDGQLELVVTTGNCGAHTCFETIHVGQWDGETWHALGQPSTTYPDWVQWTDEDGDGIEEVLLHGGTIGSAGAGLHRPSTFVYVYCDEQYRLTEQRRDPSTHIYFTMIDAHEALRNDEYDRAFELASRNLAQPAPPERANERGESDFAGVTEASYERIMTYSGIEMMLVYGLGADATGMEAVLAHIERRADEAAYAYVWAARCLWQTYRESGDIHRACQAMQWTVEYAGTEAGQLLELPGYATEVLPLDRLCPLSQDAD
jgi:hypothetical protein